MSASGQHFQSRSGDQAAGLRQHFSVREPVVLPVVANNLALDTPTLLNALTRACNEAGATTLLVDAADTSPEPSDLLWVDLEACVETVDPSRLYLPARGLLRRCVDPRGSASSALPALSNAAPQADVLLLHGEPDDLARVLSQSPVRPVVLCGSRQESLEQAYAACKVLHRRARLSSFDLLLSGVQGSAMTESLQSCLSLCLSRFLEAVLVHAAVVDPRAGLNVVAHDGLSTLIQDRLHGLPRSIPLSWRAGRELANQAGRAAR